MSVFKVGDRVTTARKDLAYLVAGRVYTIEKLSPTGRLLTVDDNSGQVYAHGIFTLASSQQRSYIDELAEQRGSKESGIIWQEYKPLPTKLCTCDMYEVFRSGCRCGAIVPYKVSLI